MKLGVVFGYWGASPRTGFVELAQDAERLGYDSLWVAESWGNDAFTFGAWVAARTETIKIGTGVVQLAARTPTATAMAAVTLDHLSNGRLILGLGVSGPQVVEGWYGQPSNRPLARTREYVEVIRRALRRDGPLEFDGEFYPLPYRGPGSVGLGKPLKIMTHPLRSEIPIYLGAEGPKNVTQTAEIADGWLPLYYSPYRPEVYADQLVGAKDGFEIASLVTFSITDDVHAALAGVRSGLGFYIGGMGAKGQNYHTKLMARMGYEEEAYRVQDLFFEGKREEAIAAVPEEFADEISLVGSPERIRARLEAWRSSPVTTLLVGARDAEQLSLVRDPGARVSRVALVTVDDVASHVKQITLNRPERLNALNFELTADLHDALDAVASDGECRVAVLTGAGRGFCSGLDLKDFGAPPAPGEHPHVHAGIGGQEFMANLTVHMRSTPQIVIAAVNGPAYGGGLGIAAAADLRIAAESATFCSAFIRTGLTGTDIGVSYTLPRLLGASRAFDLIVTGRTIDAVEAEHLGLVSRVVPDDALRDEAIALASRIAAYTAVGLRMTKEVMWANLDAPNMAAAIVLENRNQTIAGRNPEVREYMDAYMAPRRH